MPATPLEIRCQIFIQTAYKIHKIQPHCENNVTCICMKHKINLSYYLMYWESHLKPSRYWSLHDALAKKCSGGPSRYCSLRNSLATKTLRGRAFASASSVVMLGRPRKEHNLLSRWRRVIANVTPKIRNGTFAKAHQRVKHSAHLLVPGNAPWV